MNNSDMKMKENMCGVYIALGGNLSNQKTRFREALGRLNASEANIRAVSGLWKSPSWPPGQGHPDYLNAVAFLETRLSPFELLALLQQIEQDEGRVRTVRNAPRTLDLDIIDYDRQIMDTRELTLPHPRMNNRGFVLFPLAQIAPEWTDPLNGQHIEEYISRLPLADVAPMSYQGRFYD